MRGSRLPGAPESEDRIICHVDMDCFYAACERLREPELEGEPVVVGMGFTPGENTGAVATASYEAREFGVESAQGIETAMDRLPPMYQVSEDSELEAAEAGYYRPVDMEFYESVSEDVREILRDVADTLRIVSIDEAYLDVTESTDWAHVEGVARHLVDRIHREVGVTASIGVAPTMSAAKIASDYDKPEGLVVVEPDEVSTFLAPLDIERLHGIGPVTATELRSEGIKTIGDFAEVDETTVADKYGDRGRELLRRARGVDDREVTPRGEPKSLSRESALGEPTADVSTKRDRIETLASSVADRAHRKGALYRTIGIKVVEPPFEVNTRAESLSGPVDDPDLVKEIALELLDEFEETKVRKLGVRVSNLEFASGEQSDLGGWTGHEEGEGIRSYRPDRRRTGGQASITDFEEDTN